MSQESQTLYPPSEDAPEKGPRFSDQVVGLFTDPVALFQRLHRTPQWGAALGAVLIATLVMTAVWALKVDVDAMLRPMFERGGQMTSSQIDTVIDMQKKFILPFGMLQAALGVPLVTLVVALIYWLVGWLTAEGEKPSYVHALSAVAVPSLVQLLSATLVTLMCLVRPVGGARPDQLSPASVAFYVSSESPKIAAALGMLDLFQIAAWVLAWLSVRHILKAKPLGAWIVVVLMIGLRSLGILFAR